MGRPVDEVTLTVNVNNPRYGKEALAAMAQTSAHLFELISEKLPIPASNAIKQGQPFGPSSVGKFNIRMTRESNDRLTWYKLRVRANG